MLLHPEEQMKIIQKGAESIVDEKELMIKLEKSFKEQRPLTIKLGLDPSAPDIHIGHAVVLRKIKQMQDLGHHAVILIGDFTGRIGDPTGKAKGRIPLSDEQVKENALTYTDQIFRVLDQEKTTVRFNSEWLANMTFEEVIRLAASTSVARILERDDFQKRYHNQTPIGLHEFFYPLMQAQDSVELKADIELGGTDQTFNILMGRTLQKHVGMEKQIAIFMPLLEGLDGIEKMSKSLGNYIGVQEPPEVMFKKVMEVPDQLIIKYFELATDVHPDDVQNIKNRLDHDENPRDIKLELARHITALYHGEEGATAGKHYFETAFQQNDIPDVIPEILVDLEKDLLADVIPQLVERGFVKSKSELVRMIRQNGVSLNQQKITAEELDRVVMTDDVLKIGKKRFVKFVK
ncbi:tyrosyl-tRNA synthetase 2 [Jeotgalibacillus alimentarius]|uniref:Tyrosine--tRNA ligase n=1 Tax=Jeotgalibacillus alimentarius TaxID=135826 RepID=A0A0C2VRB3_9BACL|nr:tyrosine--tRNA ligase [Jeotgalibacillus alimentarius]KIL51462.1 tyrosyl-tRNA synthetase 2 [Jeotgalibacillus alimentarius]